MSYAEGTTVAVEKSKAELEAVIRRHGGYNYGSGSRDAEGVALVYFTIGKDQGLRQVRLLLPLPKISDFKPLYGASSRKRSTEQRWEQACRERWRLLVLVVRAKLELVAVGGSTIDGEFLASIALPDGQTVLQLLAGALETAYRTSPVSWRAAISHHKPRPGGRVFHRERRGAQVAPRAAACRVPGMTSLAPATPACGRVP